MIPDQTSADYDAWLQWDVSVLKAYADCKARHHATVQSWPTGQSQPAPKKSWFERNFGG